MFLLLLLASRAAYATTVTDLSDDASDTGSLRYAVNNASDGDTINFASNVVGTISTTSTLTISHSITITGPGAALLKVVRSGSTAGDVFDVGNGITVTINGISISSGTQGRGITNNSTSSTLVVNDCAFPNNAPSGNQSGGAIANQGALTVYDSVFVGNFAYLGGAIANGGTATVFGSTFSANQGASNGAAGAIYNIGSMTIENSTFFANSAANNGNAIYNVATLNIKASTFSDGSEDIINSGGTVTLANSIVTGSCDSCGTQSGINLIGSGAGELGPLQYNGGFTPTVMPLPGSSDILSQGSNSGLSTDQRNFARSATGATDLGAVQTNYLMVTNRNDSGSGSLRDAMAAAITDGSGDIVFQSGLTGTITLVSSLPPISTGYLNIAGPGANKLTIDGAGNHQILDFSGTGQQVNISGLTIADGNQNAGYAGGIQNSGALIAENVAFTGNGGDTGGAIYNDGTLVLENSTFSNNTATSGAGIANASTGKLVLANGTFNGNTANGGNGGALDNNGGVVLVSSGTVSGNNSKNGGIGAGISNDSGTLVLTNSIVSANMNLQSGTEDDCSNCGTQSTAYNLIRSTTNLNLGALAYNGKNATLQTMLPLPGSVAIQAGDPTQALAGLDMDERGFPRLTGGNLDLGAAQTNYTAVQFLQQPTNTIVNANINPAVTVEVLETNTTSNATDTVDGIPITLTLSGSGTLSGGTPAQTTSGGVATFANLAVDTANTGDTLATAPIAVSSGLTLPTVTSNTFDITLITTTVSFNPGLPTSVTYGDAPLTLKANAYASGTPTNQTLSFQVDSGPATVSGNVLTPSS